MTPTRSSLASEAEDHQPALELLLNGAVRDAEDLLSRNPEISSWLREEALRAAMQIGQEADLQAGVSALSDLVYHARGRYRTLDETISAETRGHARLGVHLDPLNPDHSHLKIAFRNGRHYDAFRRIETLDRHSVMNAIDSLIEMMPKTAPFAGHPHSTTSLVTTGEVSLKLTIETSATGAQSRETFRIDAEGFQPLQLSSRESACDAVLQYFSYAGGSGDRPVG